MTTPHGKLPSIPAEPAGTCRRHWFGHGCSHGDVRPGTTGPDHEARCCDHGQIVDAAMARTRPDGAHIGAAVAKAHEQNRMVMLATRATMLTPAMRGHAAAGNPARVMADGRQGQAISAGGAGKIQGIGQESLRAGDLPRHHFNHQQGRVDGQQEGQSASLPREAPLND